MLWYKTFYFDKSIDMFKQNSKYRLVYLILAFAVFAFGSALAFYDYYDAKQGMKLFGGIVFGLMTIFQGRELYNFWRHKTDNV
jgi:hypothetical protein